MCGIAGIIRFSGDEPVRFEDIAPMAAVLRHRGPDDEGFLGVDLAGKCIECFGPETPESVRTSTPQLMSLQLGRPLVAALGHRRLSIVDTSAAGHQPMHDPSRRRWIVFNGEIYNFIELRAELKSEGICFHTGTDTEVILAAYDRWGPNCLTRFNGMWAMAILDLDRRQLFLSRDRFGIKPLYYALCRGILLFASEIKAILTHPVLETTPNLSYLRDVLSLGAMEHREETAFSGIFRFPMASYATIDLDRPNARLNVDRFWDYEPNVSRERFDHERSRRIASDYYDLLKDSVRLRLRSDVPVCSALSGGLDSSSVVYLVNQLLHESGCSSRQVAFSTVHFDSAARDCDESEYIRRIVTQLDIESHVVEPDPAAIPMIHEAAVWCLECPYEGTGMPGMYVFGLARANGVTVTLDGQGADEQQAGYLNYFTQRLGNAPLSEVLRAAFDRSEMLGTESYVRFGVKIGLLRAVLGSRLLVSAARMFGKDAVPHIISLNARLKEDCHRGLVNLIHYSDARSMVSSVESRMPFMDYRLVEFTAGVPACYKIHRGWTKYFARLAFDGKLPDSITWRKDKLGWPMPDAYWLSGPLRKWHQELISNSSLVTELCRGASSPKTSTELIRRMNIAQWEKVFWESSGLGLRHRTDLALATPFRLPVQVRP